MKHMKILFVFLIAFALTSAITAQECGLYTMSKGSVFGYQSMDAKGKITGTSKTTCLDVTKIGSAIIYKIKGEYADENNKNQTAREYEMRCDDGKFYMDMNVLVDPKTMEGFKDMEVSVDSKDMIYPNHLSPGQTLPDASITVSAGSGGVNIMNMVINVINRSVIDKESVTVPAGTFDCYKITYNVETKLMFKITTSVTEYMNMGVGSVKTEIHDKKGKLVSSTVLSEIKK